MSETLITQSGGTISFRESGQQIQYFSSNFPNWVTVNFFPIKIENLNPSSSNILNIKLESNISTSSHFRFNMQYQSYINFDGQNYTININNINQYVGLLDIYNGQQIHIKNINLTATGTSALIPNSGWLMSGGDCHNCSVSFCSSNGPISRSGCGGIVGANILISNFIVEGCFSSGVISGNGAGGIAGLEFRAILRDCRSTGNITGEGAGGIVGGAGRGTITKASSSGVVSGQGAGGIGGASAIGLAVSVSYSTGNVTGWGAGGVLGGLSGTVTVNNSFSAGVISGPAAGGIFGNSASPTAVPTAVYVANGVWSNTVASQVLIGVPSTFPGEGSVWSSLTGSGSFAENNTILNITNVISTTNGNVIEILGSGLWSVSSVLINTNVSPLTFNKNSDSSIYVTLSKPVVITSVKLVSNFGLEEVYTVNPPLSPVCFPSGTPVLTDQGIINIEKINRKIHTINNKKIVDVTKTINNEKHLVCIEKNALGDNIPNKKTIISSSHKIMYKDKLIPARNLTKYIENKKDIYNIDYNGEILYNILMEEHETMNVNNMIVETLNPKNIIAKLYSGKYNKEEKQIIIDEINVCMKNNELIKYREISRKLK